MTDVELSGDGKSGER